MTISPRERRIEQAAAVFDGEDHEYSRRFWEVVPRNGAECACCGYSLEGLSHDRCPECSCKVEVQLVCSDMPCSHLRWAVFALACGIGFYGTLSVLSVLRSRQAELFVPLVGGSWAVLSGMLLLVVICRRTSICRSSRVARWSLCLVTGLIQAVAIALPWWFGIMR